MFSEGAERSDSSNREELPIIGPTPGGRFRVQVSTPDRLEDWPNLPGLPRPGSEREEARLVTHLNELLAHALESKLGLFGRIGGHQPIVLTNRDPADVQAHLEQVQAEQLEAMMDPVNMGIGSIRMAVFRSLKRSAMIERGQSPADIESVDWGVLRDLLHELLPTAALRLHKAEGIDQVRAAQFICLCRTPLRVSGGPIVLFGEGLHPVVDATYEKAVGVLKAAYPPMQS